MQEKVKVPRNRHGERLKAAGTVHPNKVGLLDNVNIVSRILRNKMLFYFLHVKCILLHHNWKH